MLIDLVRARRFEMFTEIDSETTKLFPAIVDDVVDLPPVTVIKADNIAEYYTERFYDPVSTKLGSHHDVMKDLFNLAPPFQRFWVEYAMPEMLKSPNLPSRIGVGFLGFEVAPEYQNAQSARNYLENYFHEAGHAWGREGLVKDAAQWISQQRLDPTKSLRWILESLTFAESRQARDRAIGPVVKTITMVSTDGSLCSLPLCIFKPPEGYKQGVHDTATAFAILTRPALMTITFMHAKNVTLKQGEPHPPKVQAKRVRNGKLPLVPYKTIDIRPVQQVIRQIAATDNVSETEAIKRLKMHGHFKDYSQHGLFGKHKGVYFWHGFDSTKPEGIIRRDYRVRSK